MSENYAGTSPCHQHAKQKRNTHQPVQSNDDATERTPRDSDAAPRLQSRRDSDAALRLQSRHRRDRKDAHTELYRPADRSRAPNQS